MCIRDRNYVGGEGEYSIALAPGKPKWGEIIGPDYTIRVTINDSSRPMDLFFVNAPGLATGVRDVEFSFGTVDPGTILTVSGSIQVSRTDPSLFDEGTPVQPTQGSSSSSTLSPGAVLQPGQSLRSDNGAYRLVLQNDGNLVAYSQENQPVWHTRTNGERVTHAVMQHDGNFVLYDGVKPIWNSQTHGLSLIHISEPTRPY